ncbi:MAG: hypothetical protein ACW963_08410, partial [Candidatus Sifarchaeia archaeon]
YGSSDLLLEIDLKINKVQLCDTFNLDTQLAKKISELFDTPTLKEIRSVEGLSLEEFAEEMSTYVELLNYLIQNHLFDPHINVRVFHGLHAEKFKQLRAYGRINWSKLYNYVIELV